ncbi:MAG: DUF898 family protein, partial [Alphaproteobacteria bacterium]|nr:DUF898 family protein [Alphaproteobacteria bacterium]
LLLVTLGIYRFWLVTDIRRHLWNNTEIAGDLIEYIGTGRELLLGFLIAIVLLVPIYVVFYLGALAPGILAQSASVAAFAALAVLGQFAVYRARRYRLARTAYRGIGFHQTGSAWRYAVCAIFWWGMIAITLGLAYPWAQAALERFKIRNTFYGELQGYFAGSGTRLFFRGFVFWLLVIGPLILGVMVAFGAVDWNALGEAYRRGPREMFNGAEGAGAATAAAFAALAVGWSLIAMAVLYPAFQAMVLRWWMSGLRFGKLTVTSRLRTGAVYGLYWRFVRVSLLFAIIPALAAGAIYWIGAIEQKSETMQLAQTVLAIGTYVVTALAYSVIYQATVRLRLWKASFESLALENVEVLYNVKAAPARASAVGEGIANALHVGGY